ncbi:hypothetical protein E5Q_04164 [Mixia osmundae IAM 14324]|uniref:Integrase catalytic domain-containing protein n=1 Tax=Mixia osmundae (strain CBS 9802 / IAM 14324 / JCM 22182 / KY 12970) TaxID=764103 RepID=G7E3S6_MIXOS|nr:hypothetical protein E5Q_04164 [Mixia osmundae IAM 14324]
MLLDWAGKADATPSVARISDDKKDLEAYLRISARCTRGVCMDIGGVETGYEASKILADNYSKLSRRELKMKEEEFNKIFMRQGESLDDFARRIEVLGAELRESDSKVSADSEAMALALLDGKSRSALRDVVSILKRGSTADSEGVASAFPAQSSNMSRREHQKVKGRKPSDSQLEATFLLDTSANHHYVSDRRLFETYQTTPHASVKGITSQPLAIAGQGRVVVWIERKGSCFELVLPTAYHVPTMKTNLISWSSLVEDGIVPCPRGPDTITLTHKGKDLCSFKRRNGLYYVRQAKDDAFDFTATITRQLAHERTGHKNDEALSALQNCSTGFKLASGSSKPIVCKGCQLGKGHRDPFPESQTVVTEPFALVSGDIAGPIGDATPEGYTYFVLFVDHYSRFHFVRLLRTKAEALAALQALHHKVETRFGRKIKVSRSDNDSVFLSRQAEQFYAETGIEHQTSVIHTPQQDGMAERGIRTVSEDAKALIHGAENLLTERSVPKLLWGEAVRTATYLMNVTWRKPIRMTPHERLTGIQPDLSHLRVFGSPAYAHIPKVLRDGKFGPHRQLCIFVGYPDGKKAWRFCWDPRAAEFIAAREATFIESARVETFHSDPVMVPERRGETSEPRIQEIIETDPHETDSDISDGDTAADQEGFVSAEESAEEEMHERGMSSRQACPRVTTPTAELVVPPPKDPSGSRDDRAKSTPPHPILGADPSVSASIGEIEQTAAEGELGRGKRTKRPSAKARGFVSHLAHNPSIVSIPRNVKEALASPQADYWKDAMDAEYESMAANKVWELVELPPGRKAIDTLFVFATKVDEKGEVYRYKARLVAKGYRQIPGVDYFETSASVASLPAVRTVLALAASRDYELIQADITSAFLNSPLEEDIYIKQQADYTVPGQETLVCKLKKAIYGLKQAGLAWVNTLSERLIAFGLDQTEADPNIYTKPIGDDLLVLIVYVDDLLIASPTQSLAWELVDFLAQTFQFKRIGEPKKFLGIELSRNRAARTISLRQSVYAQDIVSKAGLAQAKTLSVPMDKATHQAMHDPDGKPCLNVKDYQSGVGALSYLAMATRPDLAFAGRLMQPSSWGGHITGLEGYCDAAFADNPDTARSSFGYVFMLGHGAISWASKRQTLIAKSTAEAEIVSASETLKQAIWLGRLLRQLGLDQGPVHLRCDNQSALKIASGSYSARTKHFNLRYRDVVEHVANKLVTLSHVNTADMIADGMTKPMPRDRHTLLAREIGIQI